MHGSASARTHLDFPFSSWSERIVICWWSVVFVRANGCELCKIPIVTVGLESGTEGKGKGEIKKTRGRGDFKVAKCAGLCLNDGWRIVLISVPRGEHAGSVSLSPHISCDRSQAPGNVRNPAVITAPVRAALQSGCFALTQQLKHARAQMN